MRLPFFHAPNRSVKVKQVRLRVVCICPNMTYPGTMARPLVIPGYDLRPARRNRLERAEQAAPPAARRGAEPDRGIAFRGSVL